MMAAKKKDVRYYGTGRRKASIARVYLLPGSGKITVNGEDVNTYLPHATLVMDLRQPLTLTGTTERFDVVATVKGGGFTGQAGALRLGIARALLEYDAENVGKEDSYRSILKANGFITRDARAKERKKPGLKAARRAPQFSKR